MLYCRNCGSKLKDNSRSCSKCGTPVVPETITIEEKDGKFVADFPVTDDNCSVSVVDAAKEDVIYASEDEGEMVIGSWEDDRSKHDDSHRKSKPDRTKVQSEGKVNSANKGSKPFGGIIGLVLPVLLVLVGIAIYSFITSNDGDGSDSESIYNKSYSLKEKKKDIESQSPTDSSDKESSVDAQMADSKSTETTEESQTAILENTYTGTWESVGLVVFKYRDIVDYNNGDLGRLIDRKMTKTSDIRFSFGSGIARMWVNDKLNLDGRYNVRESGNISVDSASGERTMLWMYAPDNSTLYSYVYYIEEDGTEMTSCIKFNRKD